MITLFGGRTRSLKLGRWGTLAILGALPLLATWYLGATLYFVFHDQLLASLMSHQMDMQYAYEDKIAALRTQLDRETSRGMIDRRTLDTTLHDLTIRGDQLAAHAATIDAIVNEGLPSAHAASRKSGNPLLAAPAGAALPDGLSAFDRIEPAPPSAGDLRLDRSGAAADGAEQHSELSPQRNDVAELFDRVETDQTQTLARLRDPLIQSVQRLTAALTDVGIPTRRLGTDGGVGGPFEPLPPLTGTGGFEASVALLQDAVREKRRLDLVVERVPLRRPLEGQLEVTSTFGARLDPFYGRPAMHTGIDLHEETGDAVVSTAAGIVTIAGTEGGYGNMVEIDHGNGLATRYAHLSAIEVVPHQMVPAGFRVGRVGSTGRATGPHLHYETRVNGAPVDPARFLRAGAPLFPG